MSANLEGMNLEQLEELRVELEAAIEREKAKPAEHEARQAAEMMKKWCTGRDCSVCFLDQDLSHMARCGVPENWQIPAVRSHSMLALAGVIKAHCAGNASCDGCSLRSESDYDCPLTVGATLSPASWDVPVTPGLKYDPLTAAREIKAHCGKTECSDCQMYDKHKGCAVALKTTGRLPEDWELPS